MSLPAQPLSNPIIAGEAVIVGAEIAAGHDGTADMVLQIQYENGVVAPLVLDQETGLDLMQACGAASLAGLVGRSWREIFTPTSLPPTSLEDS
jgi:hypothetical protein